MTTSTIPKMLTYAEAALRIRVSVRTVYRIVKAGDLRVQRIGKRCSRLVEDEVEAYIRRSA